MAESPIVRMVEPEHAGCRLDVFLARQFPEFSRSLVRRGIDAGGVTVQGKPLKAGQRLKGGEQLSIVLPDLPRQAPSRKIFRWRFCSRTNTWRQSTNRQAWWCIRRKGIGRER